MNVCTHSLNTTPLYQLNHDCPRRCQIIPDFFLADLALLNDEEVGNASPTSPRHFLQPFNPPLLKAEKIKVNITFSAGIESRVKQRHFAQVNKLIIPSRKPAHVMAGALPLDLADPVEPPQPPLVKTTQTAFRVFDADYKPIADKEYKPLPLKDSSLLPFESFADWPDYAKNVYDGAKKVYEFYQTEFGVTQEAWGSEIDSTVNVREWRKYPPNSDNYQVSVMSNAYWDGYRMAYGEGDNTVFYDFTRSKEIIGHELTHRLTQFAYKFDIKDYHDQSGALNEHISDVFGIIFSQWEHKEENPSEANWLVGSSLIKDDFKRMLKVRKFGHYDALRSLKAPGSAYEITKNGDTKKDPQPESMLNYDKREDDYGGVHINSGILNKAFYLFATNIGGASWKIPGRLWFDTITSGQITSQSQFIDFAKATVKIAKDKFPSAVQTALKQAWTEVQVLNE